MHVVIESLGNNAMRNYENDYNSKTGCTLRSKTLYIICLYGKVKSKLI